MRFADACMVPDGVRLYHLYSVQYAVRLVRGITMSRGPQNPGLAPFWNWLDPDVRALLKARIAGARVLAPYSHEPVDCPDPGALVDCGFIRESEFRDGTVFGVVDGLAVIAAFDEQWLARALGGLRATAGIRAEIRGPILDRIYLWLESGMDQRIWSDFIEWDLGDEELCRVMLVMAALADRDVGVTMERTKAYVLASARSRLFDRLCFCARLYSRVMGLHAHAVAHLALAESGAVEPSQWAQMAGIWITIPDRREKAAEALSHAETIVQSASDMKEVVGSWRFDFSSPDDARRCLNMAEVMEPRSADWLWMARVWAAGFGDLREVRRCLNMAMTCARRPARILPVAESWMAELGSRDDARRGILLAEGGAVDVLDWMDIAAAWATVLNETDEVMRCLVRAESMASKCMQYRDMARYWLSLLNREKDARRCMMAAESVAENYADWWLLAETWRYFTDAGDDHHRCRTMAESMPIRLSEPLDPPEA